LYTELVFGVLGFNILELECVDLNNSPCNYLLAVVPDTFSHISSGKHWASQVVLEVKNPPANQGDVRDRGSIPGSGRSPE